MTDRPQVPPETTEGWRRGSSGGERILVGLAALALLVAGLIVAGNLLLQDEAAVASHSPQPSEQPSRTPFPTLAPFPIPTPIEFVLESAPLPSVEAIPELFNGLIRARVELQILGDTQLDSAPIGVLAAGELIGASELPDLIGEEGWVWVASAVSNGYVATRAAGADLVDRYPQPPSAVSGYISTLAAGPDGFIGFGAQPGTSAAYPPSMLIQSLDGVRWQLASDQPPAGLSQAAGPAWGPVGWLLVSLGPEFESWFSTSADGSHWSIRGTMRTSTASYQFFPSQLVASGAGYLLRSFVNGHSEFRPLMFSENGVNWHGVDPGLNTNDYLIGGTAGGFYAWRDPQYGRTPKAAFSIDGVTWSPVAGGPEASDIRFAAVGDRWFAIESDQTTGAPRVWRGTISGGELSWQRMPGAVASFAGAVVTALVSTGDEAIAFGWDRTTEVPLTWTTTGSGWVRSELPAAFGGIPEAAAAGSAGVVVVGHALSAPSEDPVVWHRAPNRSWQPERDPVIARIPEPSLADCAPLPRDALAFLIEDWATAALCHGHVPMTFRAWSTHCWQESEDSYLCGGEAYGTSQPAWLAAPAANMLFLSPTETGNAFRRAVLPPTLATSPPAAWVETWLEITGHFDDPAAKTCQYTPPPDDLSYVDPASAVNGCRQQFVVTAVRVVGGP